MKFKVENGKGLIGIGMSDIGSYFKLKYPKSIAWYDCCGSLGKYLSVSYMDESMREKVLDQLRKILYYDYSEKIEELYSEMLPLLNLLENGAYHLKYMNPLKNVPSQHILKRTQQFNWNIELPKATLKELEHQFYEKHNEEERIIELTYNFYATHYYLSLVATLPLESISKERVQYFKEEIKSGKRPFAIILNAYYQPESDACATRFQVPQAGFRSVCIRLRPVCEFLRRCPDAFHRRQ